LSSQPLSSDEFELDPADNDECDSDEMESKGAVLPAGPSAAPMTVGPLAVLPAGPSLPPTTTATAADDASKKCKEAGGAQDSIGDDDDDNDGGNFESGDRYHEVHCTIKDIDILAKRKNSGDKIEYKNHGGNIWLKQLCQEKVEEYCNIVGNRANMRKNIFVRTIIDQLANENRRVLQMRNGEWAQLKEPDVRRNIITVMGNAKRKMNIMAPVVPERKSKYWKDSEEKRLCDWYSKKNS
jgi:hypothetical protein